MTIEVELETDGSWIAETVDVPGATAYGVNWEEAVAKAIGIAARASGASGYVVKLTLKVSKQSGPTRMRAIGKENKALRDALAEYANEQNWAPNWVIAADSPLVDTVWVGGGSGYEIAQKALTLELSCQPSVSSDRPAEA